MISSRVRCRGGRNDDHHGIDTYSLRSGNLSLTSPQKFLKKLPSPSWEGMKGRGDQTVSILSTPTLALPHRRGEIVAEMSRKPDGVSKIIGWDKMKGFVIDPEKDGERFNRGSADDKTLREIRWLIDEERVNSKQFVGGLATFPPGMAAPFHTHPDAEEITIVLEGEGIFVTPGAEKLVKKGQWQFIPKGVEHSHKNTGTEPFIFVWIYSPATQSTPR
jgi:quercetin dioxygenase-like cupin family protein